jgi:hypothetical protein
MALGRGRRGRLSTRPHGLSPLEVEVWATWNHIKSGAPAYRRQRRDWAMRWARHAAAEGRREDQRATTLTGVGNRVGRRHVETFWRRPEVARLAYSTQISMWRAIADTWAAAGMAQEPPRPPASAPQTQDSDAASHPQRAEA